MIFIMLYQMKIIICLLMMQNFQICLFMVNQKTEIMAIAAHCLSSLID